MADVLRVRDYLGREVALTERGWDHIRWEHPDMERRLNAIEAALRDPAVVTMDKVRARVENHYRRHGERYLVKVCVIYRPEPTGSVGEIVTAHLAPRVGRKEQPIWP